MTLDEMIKTPVDSAKGIAYVFEWARGHDAVLPEYHERIATKFGVSTDGVRKYLKAA